MRNQYKVLAEKYSIVQEASEDDKLNMGMFGSDLWDQIKTYPDKHEFVKWLLNSIPTERVKIPGYTTPWKDPPKTYERSYYGIDAWISDLTRYTLFKNNALDRGFNTDNPKMKQCEADILYKKFQAYKQHLNKDNPGVSPNF